MYYSYKDQLSALHYFKKMLISNVRFNNSGRLILDDKNVIYWNLLEAQILYVRSKMEESTDGNS